VADEVLDAAVAALQAQLPVARPESESERRRQSTVLFADISGFTALSEDLDPELVAELMNELWLFVDNAIVARGGRVDKRQELLHLQEAEVVDSVSSARPELPGSSALVVQRALATTDEVGVVSA
jgi:hypothetical protein